MRSQRHPHSEVAPSPRSYEEAGVSIGRGDSIAAYVARHHSSARAAIGGFAGGTPIDVSGYQEPLLLSTTDGVGTKILVAQQQGRFDTIGIDLVAMCVNDLAVCGAEPIQFLDYIACGKIREQVVRAVIDGVLLGCEQAGCVLAGGETAEMPDAYPEDGIDLAGFSVGIVESRERLPRLGSIKSGDAVIGIASSGIHSNGLSLARKVLTKDAAGAELLLEPTRIYVRFMTAVRRRIHAAAHVTGGGLAANLARVIPQDLCAKIDWSWQVPEVFQRISKAGAIENEEMRRVFNMGIGLALVVRQENVEEVLSMACEHGESATVIGKIDACR